MLQIYINFVTQRYFMSKFITQNLNVLSPLERREIERLAFENGMTIEEWFEYLIKSQIYATPKIQTPEKKKDD